MPIRLPFNFPYFYNNYRYPNNSVRHNRYPSNTATQSSSAQNSQTEQNYQAKFKQGDKKIPENSNSPNSPNSLNNSENSNSSNNSDSSNSSNNSDNSDRTVSSESSEPSESSECLFEIFGLRLHFDDVLIMCILFFLYKEEVQDEELFLCLILLLIS